jgi:hypothetical protein
MSTQQFLMDAATRHQVFLQRYGNGRSKEAVKLLNRLRKKINARLASRANRLSGATITRRAKGG